MRLAAQIARLANKKTSTEVLIVFCLRKRTERFFFLTDEGLKFSLKSGTISLGANLLFSLSKWKCERGRPLRLSLPGALCV